MGDENHWSQYTPISHQKPNSCAGERKYPSAWLFRAYSCPRVVIPGRLQPGDKDQQNRRVTRLQLVGRNSSATERIKWNANLSQNARGELNPDSKKRARNSTVNRRGKAGGCSESCRGGWTQNPRVWLCCLTPLKAKFWCLGCVFSPSLPPAFPRQPWLLCLTITISATTVFLSSRTTSPLLLPCYPRRMGLSQLLHSACLSLPFIHSFLLGSLNLEGSKGGMRKPSQSFKTDWSIFIIYHICLNISLSMLI